MLCAMLKGRGFGGELQRPPGGVCSGDQPGPSTCGVALGLPLPAGPGIPGVCLAPRSEGQEDTRAGCRSNGGRKGLEMV